MTRNDEKAHAAWAAPTKTMTVGALAGDAVNLNIEGRALHSPLQGFGQMWQRTYRLPLAGPGLPNGQTLTPERVVAEWKAHLPEFMPDDSRFYPTLTGVKPGEAIVINASLPAAPGVAMPVDTGVMVLYSDDTQFTVMTPAGHPESGFNTFSAFEEDGITIAQIQSLARATDPIYEIGFRLMGGAKQQARIWRHVLTHLGAHFGVAGEPTVQSVRVDPRLQWSRAGNLWQNALIRTVLSAPARWLRRK